MSRTLRGCVTLCCKLLVVAQSLRPVILVFKEWLELRGGVLLFAVGCLLLCKRYVWLYWFRRMSQTLRWCVTLCCRLLVIVRPLRLVALVFEECLKLCGGVLLFVVDCLLLCDCYVWSYWSSTLLVVHAFCTASGCGFLAVNWAVGVIRKKIFPFSYFLVIDLLPGVLCFVDVLYLGFV